MQKSTYLLRHAALHLKSSYTEYFSWEKSTACSSGRLNLPSTPTPFSQEILTAARQMMCGFETHAKPTIQTRMRGKFPKHSESLGRILVANIW